MSSQTCEQCGGKQENGRCVCEWDARTARLEAENARLRAALEKIRRHAVPYGEDPGRPLIVKYVDEALVAMSGGVRRA